MRWGCSQCAIRCVLSTNRGVVWCAFKAAHRLSHWKSTSKLPFKSMFCGGGGGNMKFLDVCIDSFLVLASYIPPWQKRWRIKIHTSRFIMSEKRLISSILIRLVLHRRIGWRGLFGVPIDRGRLPQNSRTSFPQPRENDADWLRKNKIF